ncbi:MAG: phosphoribosylanthranilate isomerase [Candidatus Thermoplasmatota archaeon]|nr:phosphoribosylanthranilate isomerase [Candidatus Thermoplasmatota archaeon]
MQEVSDRGRFMVKVCGITNFEDGELAVELGASMLGVVRTRSSPRYAGSELFSLLRPLGVPLVGVYTSMNEIPEVPEEDIVQLHFDHGRSEIESVKRRGKTVISVITYRSVPDFIERYENLRAAGADLIMLERKEGIVALGKPLLHLSMMYDFGISGKISHDEIEFIREIKPKFIDLSSSLEEYPGKKDRMKMERFFRLLGGN